MQSGPEDLVVAPLAFQMQSCFHESVLHCVWGDPQYQNLLLKPERNAKIVEMCVGA